MTTPDAVRSTVADVDLDAVAANLTSIRDRAKADVIAVVKADAYGHGAEAVAEISFEAGAVMVAVATVEEGLALREAGVNGPILVFFGPTDSSEVAHAVAQDLVLTVWDQARARAISEAATALRRTARVHFKVDTGLTRLGAPTSEAAERLREIRTLPRIEVDGIFTHLATADDPDTSNDQAQLARFQEVLGAIRDRPRLVHAVASAGVAAFGEVEGVNAVRPGLAIYGVHPAAHLATALALRPALTWHSRIHRIASVPKGTGVSYGHEYRLPRDGRIATVLLVGACVRPATKPTESTEPPSTYIPSTPTPVASTTLTSLDMTATLLAKPLPYADGFVLTRTVRGRDGKPAKGFEAVRTAPPVEGVGAAHEFWTYDFAAKKNVKTTAMLRLVTDHAKWWVATDATLDLGALGGTASEFEAKIYPTDRRLYGEEWSPGIDGDPRINLVFARLPGSAVGYFSGSDEEPAWVNEFSAEREMIYVNSLAARLGSPQLDSIIAHEFCHMIQFNTRRRSAVWFNEGHAQLCEQGNGFSPGTAQTYLRLPDTQLNDWSDLEAAAVHYGLAFMFLEFLRQQAGGEDLIRAMMQKGIDTPADIDAVLKQRGQPGVEELYANFVAANAFLGTTPDKQYSYPQTAPARQAANVVLGDIVTTGGTFRSTVHEYAVRYVELPRARMQVRFDGSTSNRLIPTDPHSGRAFWWSDKGDGMDSTLTKVIDLRSATNPQLAFWTWFDIEADYDYAYVEVSSDDGAHWTDRKSTR